MSNAPSSQPLPRNTRLFDKWSLVHTFSGIAFGWLLPPLVALAILYLWEPFEVLLLSPFLMRRGIVFGYEALPNSLSDIVFDSLGFCLGFFGLAMVFGTPEHLLHLFGQ